MRLTGLKAKYCKAVFLQEAPGENVLPVLQFLEAAPVPWPVVLFQEPHHPTSASVLPSPSLTLPLLPPLELQQGHLNNSA